MQVSHIEELELLEKLKVQNEAAFSELYTLYVKKIYAYVLGIVKSPMLAEDIVQETFVKLWESSALIQTDRPLQPFLFTVARNRALNMIRRASRESWVTDEIIEHAVHQSENGLQYTERKQTSAYINEAIAQLPPQRRLIYDLCRNYGYTYKQAAEKLGIKDSTVNSQMVKAIKSIREFLARNGVFLLFF